MKKILILESEWRKHPHAPSTETRSTSAIYRLALRGFPGVQADCQPLTCQAGQRIRDFTRLPENRRGVHAVILSGHGSFLPDNRRALAANDGLLLADDAADALDARHSLLIADACFLGQNLPAWLARIPALGVLGFGNEVNWTASSVLIHAVLRHWLEEGVFHLQRASARRPARALQRLHAGPHAQLAAAQGLAWAFRQ